MNPLPVRIRHMMPADLVRVMEIAQSLKEAPHWPRSAYETALNPQSAPQRIALVAADAESGNVAGFAVASVLPPQAELETIAVAAEGQRRGVGRNLFAALAGELVIRQVQELFLEVRVSNGPALQLYRSLGFSETGRRPRYYIDPVEDALLLTLRLA
jgi:ribosomal-protein-alanine N-acetyltransferase